MIISFNEFSIIEGFVNIAGNI